MSLSPRPRGRPERSIEASGAPSARKYRKFGKTTAPGRVAVVETCHDCRRSVFTQPRPKAAAASIGREKVRRGQNLSKVAISELTGTLSGESGLGGAGWHGRGRFRGIPISKDTWIVVDGEANEPRLGPGTRKDARR